MAIVTRNSDFVLTSTCAIQAVELNRADCSIEVADRLFSGYVTNPKDDKVFHFTIQKYPDSERYHSLVIRYGTIGDTLEKIFDGDVIDYSYDLLIDICEFAYKKKGVNFLNTVEELCDPDTPADKKPRLISYIYAWIHHRLSEDYSPEEKERLHDRMFGTD